MNGKCTACAPRCLSCDTAGAAKCDTCQPGFVVLKGTTNCTACFNNCPSCSPNDLGLCTGCLKGQFLDTSKTPNFCANCPTGCATCTSAKVCTACLLGYGLFDNLCVAFSAFCSNIVSGKCSKCMIGYNLTDSWTCVPDLACNATSKCTYCPDGTYLSNSLCLKCTLPANCLTCDPATPANCMICKDGFFLVGNVCTACSSNCLTCSSLTNCLSAANGFYMLTDDTGAASGLTAACTSPCATCANSATSCQKCINNFELVGDKCLNKTRLDVTVKLKGGVGANPFFN